MIIQYNILVFCTE